MISYTFSEQELKFTIEAWENALDDTSICDDLPDEVQGEYYLKDFDTFQEAVDKYFELKQKGWESIHLRIKTKRTNEKSKYVRFVFTDSFVTIEINPEHVNKQYYDTLLKIKDILDEVI